MEKKRCFFGSIFFLLLFFSRFLFSYVPCESLFGGTYIFSRGDDIGVSGSSEGFPEIFFIRGMSQFSQYVFGNAKPVVVHIFSRSRDSFVRSIYSQVASEMGNKVSFVSIDLSDGENFAIIKGIMGQLGIRSINVPFFLFFKQRTLMLPPVVFPTFRGRVSREELLRLKRSFKDHIRRQFFDGDLSVDRSGSGGLLDVVVTSSEVKSGPLVEVSVLGRDCGCRGGVHGCVEFRGRCVDGGLGGKSSGSVVGGGGVSWGKLRKLGDQVRRWLVGFGSVSRKEVKSCHLSKGHGRQSGRSLSSGRRRSSKWSWR